jgi:hypothetical protein
MGLMDSLRRAEEQGREAARRSLESAREHWEDAERRLRRKMRIHPRKSASRQAVAAGSTRTEAERDIQKPAA